VEAFHESEDNIVVWAAAMRELVGCANHISEQHRPNQSFFRNIIFRNIIHHSTTDPGYAQSEQCPRQPSRFGDARDFRRDAE